MNTETRLLKLAEGCDKTASNAHLYETRLRAEGRAAAYRIAAKMVGAEKSPRPTKRQSEVSYLAKRLASLV